MHKQSFFSAIVSSISWKSAGYLLSFIKHIFVGIYLGIGLKTDAFYMTTYIIGLLILPWSIICEMTLVPALIKKKSSYGEIKIKQHMSMIFIGSILISLLMTVLLLLFRYKIADLFSLESAQQKKYLAQSIVISIPIILLSLPEHIITAFLRIERQFSYINHSYFITVLLTIIVFLIFKNNDYVLSFSICIGLSASFCYLIYRYGINNLKLYNPFSREICNYFKIPPSLFILCGFSYINGFCDRLFVANLPEGNISALSYANNILGVFPNIISVTLALYTTLAEQKKIEEQWYKVEKTFSLIIFYVIPITVFLFFNSVTLITFIFKRGCFLAADCQLVATALIGLSPSLLATLIMSVVDCFLVIQKKISLIAIRSFVAIICNVILNYVFMFHFKLGISGITLATSISSWILVALTIVSLKKLGVQANIKSKLIWCLWVIIFCSIPCFAMKHYLIYTKLNNLVIILIYLSIISLSCLISGLLYPGNEKTLVKQSLTRIISSGLLIFTKFKKQ